MILVSNALKNSVSGRNQEECSVPAGGCGRALPKRAKAPLAILFVLALACAGCDSCVPPPPPVLHPKETYLLAFVDRNERVHLRASSDGINWTEDTPAGLSSGDNGAGISPSQDLVGAIRHLAYPNVAGRLRVRVGLGTGNWDPSDIEIDVRPGGRPTEVPIDANHSLFASLSAGRVVLHNIDVKRRTIADVTPSGVGTILNSNLRRTPAIARMGNRIVVAWQRFSSNEPAGQPREIQIVAGNVSAGGVITWTDAFVFPTTAFGNAISQPTLTHDHERFLLGLVRTPTPGRTFIVHSSRDGVSWTEEQNFIFNPPGDPIDTTAELAARSDGTMVAAFVGPSTRQVFRYANGQWTPLDAGGVFGPSEPHSRPFALVSAGGPEVRTARANVSNLTAGLASAPSFVSVGGRDGRLYVSYLSDKIMFVAGSMASMSFGAPIPLSASVGFASRAPIGADGNSVHVVWQDGVQDRVLKIRSSPDGGQTFANPVEVSTLGPTGKVQPAITVSGSVVHVVWTEAGAPPAASVRYRRSADGGASFGAETVLDPNANSGSRPQLAVNGSNVYVFWCGGGSARFARSTDGGATFPAFVPLGAAPSLCGEQLAVDGNRVFAGWRHSPTGNRPYDIMMNRSLDGGANFGGALNMTGLPTDSSGLRLAAKGGIAYMVWHEELELGTEIFFRQSTDGNTFSVPQQLSNPDGEESSFPDISVDGGHVHIAWMDGALGNFDVAYAHKGPGAANFDPWTFLPPTGRSPLGEGGPLLQNRGPDLHMIYHIANPNQNLSNVLYYGRRTP